MTTLTKRLTDLTLSQLAVVYNGASDLRVTKFSDRSTAVKRTELALQKRGLNFTVVGDVVTVAPLGSPAIAEGDDRIITVLVDKCPKRPGSLAERRWRILRPGMTLGQYFERCQKLGMTRRHVIRDMEWDQAHGYVRLGPAEQ